MDEHVAEISIGQVKALARAMTEKDAEIERLKDELKRLKNALDDDELVSSVVNKWGGCHYAGGRVGGCDEQAEAVLKFRDAVLKRVAETNERSE